MLVFQSLRGRVTFTIISCTFLAVLLVGSMAIFNSLSVTGEDSARFILSASESKGKNIDVTLASIETGVNTMGEAVKSELTDVNSFRADRNYADTKTPLLRGIALNCGKNVQGAMTYYVRYNPDYSNPTAGIFASKSGNGFQQLTPTDMTIYSKTDMEHVGWYYIPVNNGKPTWMNPYLNANINVYMISYVVPLFAGDGTSLGIVGMDVDFNEIKNQIVDTKLYDTGYAVLTDSSNNVIGAKEEEKAKNLKEIAPELDSYVGEKNPNSVVEFQRDGEDYVAGYYVLSNGMRFVMIVPQGEVNAASHHLVWMIILGMVITLAIGAVIGNWFSGRMIKPLQQLEKNAQTMADGDLTTVIPVDTDDEIGSAAKAFNTMTAKLRTTMQQIYSAASQVAVGSKNISDSGVMLAHGATTQAASVEQLSASINELNAKTARTADNAKEADRITASARQMAVIGNEKMGALVQAIDDIDNSSRNIAKIIKTIDEIAFQTNILALNAAVEAARAGQHGKGFAVVAEEVGNLAARSAKAAKETADIIDDSLAKINTGTILVKETKNALQEINNSVSSVSKFMDEIAEDSQKQSESLATLNEEVNQVSQVVQNNSATAQESAAASTELNGQAEFLQQEVSKFRI